MRTFLNMNLLPVCCVLTPMCLNGHFSNLYRKSLNYYPIKDYYRSGLVLCCIIYANESEAEVTVTFRQSANKLCIAY